MGATGFEREAESRVHALNTRRMGFPRAADQSETVPMRVRNTLQTVLESIEGEPSFQWMKIGKKRKRRKGREERERNERNRRRHSSFPFVKCSPIRPTLLEIHDYPPRFNSISAFQRKLLKKCPGRRYSVYTGCPANRGKSTGG